MKYRLVYLMVGLLFLMTACVTASSEPVKPAGGAGFLGIKSDDIEVDTEKAFKGADEVVIGSFKVGFVEYKKASATAGGGFLSGGGFGGKSKAKIRLSGVSDETKQAITNAAYEDFVVMLQNAGYTVIDRERLMGSEPFSQAETYPAPYQTEDSALAMYCTLNYYVPSGFQGVHFFMQDGISGVGGWGMKYPNSAAIEFAAQSGIRVLAINLLVDFANTEGSGGSFRSTSSVTVGEGLSVRHGSGLQFIGGHMGTFSTANGRVYLGQPVYSTENYADEVADVTPEGNKVVEGAVNVLSAVLGGGANVTKEFEVRADQEKYSQIVSSLIKDADQAIVDTMSRLR